MDPIEELLSRGVANIIPGKEPLHKALQSDKKLNIYLGIDPTATKIHLGHAVPLRKLQKFAELGHHVTFLIGDFTALIGDTSDKESERPVLTSEEIEKNFQTYKKQAEKVLDFSKIQVRHNSEWLKKLTFEEIIKLCQNFSFGEFASRELIRKRLDNKKHVGLHEALYPVMQGYDSYFMDTDVQLGGTDQTFNMQAGRILQKDLRHKESFVMTNEFLLGTDGRKMSKTGGNAIWLDDDPNEMYAKIMAINDDLILPYYTLGTNISLEEIAEIGKRLQQGEHPMSAKKHLAHSIIHELYSEADAHMASENFERTVQNKELPQEIAEVTINAKTPFDEDLLVHLEFASSRNEAKRLFQQGGVYLNEEKIENPQADMPIPDNSILRIGKRRMVRIKLS